jgi:hypothetical protein
VPFLLLTSVLGVSWAHFGFPEQQATSQTRPVNSQGVQCVCGVFVVDSDAKRRKNSVFGTLAPNGGRHKQFNDRFVFS